MATTAQVRKLLAPFEAERCDVVLAKRLLVIEPLRHVLRAVMFDRASDKHLVVVRPALLPVFHPEFLHLSWGWPVTRPDRNSFRLDQPDVAEVLFHVLGSDILPRLATVSDISSLLAHCQAHENRHMLDFGEGLSIACALGDFDEARRICADWRRRGILDAEGYDEASRRCLANSRELCGLVCADDRAGIIALLHRWEADTALRWGFAEIWEPSPFPVEATR